MSGKGPNSQCGVTDIWGREGKNAPPHVPSRFSALGRNKGFDGNENGEGMNDVILLQAMWA